MNKIINWFEKLLYSINMKYQQTRYGYSYYDVFNMDEFIAKKISEMSFALSETSLGFPTGLTPKKWKQILKQIAFGFGSYIEMRNCGCKIDSKEFKRLQKEYKKGLELFVKYHQYLCD